MIHIYYSYISEEHHEILLEKFSTKFSVDFQEKIKRFRRWQDAQLSLLGRVLLFNGISEIYGNDCHFNEIKYTKYNKPYFEGSPIKFSISHSGEIVVCALSNEHEIGIDIEEILDIEIADFKSQMTESEWNKIAFSNNKKDSFFDYWTQKESVIKAHGTGLSTPLKSFEIIDDTTIIAGETFFLHKIDIDEQYKCFISLNSNIKDFSVKKQHIYNLQL